MIGSDTTAGEAPAADMSAPLLLLLLLPGRIGSMSSPDPIIGSRDRGATRRPTFDSGRSSRNVFDGDPTRPIRRPGDFEERYIGYHRPELRFTARGAEQRRPGRRLQAFAPRPKYLTLGGRRACGGVSLGCRQGLQTKSAFGYGVDLGAASRMMTSEPTLHRRGAASGSSGSDTESVRQPPRSKPYPSRLSARIFLALVLRDRD